MLFYPSKNHDDVNGELFDPEVITGAVMLNPHFGATVAYGTKEVLIDSGAVQERDLMDRATPEEALARQTRQACKVVAGHRVPPRLRVVTYDMVAGVDEALVNGKRVKRRGTEETAELAVQETIKSAAYYASRRHRLAGIGLAFAAQGVSVRQYLRCTAALLDLMTPDDWYAFGGFCIIGMQSTLKPQFVETLRCVLPLLRRKGIKRAHLLGICVHDALIAAEEEGRRHGVEMSTDSSSIEKNSVYGKEWHVENMASTRSGTPWKKVFGKEHKKADGPISYHPCALALANIRRFNDWVSRLGDDDFIPGCQHALRSGQEEGCEDATR